MPLLSNPGRRRLLVIAGLVLALALGPLLVRLAPASSGVVVDVPADVVDAPAETGQGPPTADVAPQTVTVHVVGPVQRPGVVTLPQGSRVADAVAACGGFSRDDAAGVNLARLLTDGERLDLARPDTPAGGPAEGSAAALVDLNSATAQQLEELPGVGPAMASRIIDYRTEHGPFDSVEQLREVSGIGERRYAELADLVTAGPS